MMDIRVAERTLIEAAEILDRNGVPFFLVLGTCLGAVREGRIIPHDKDLDLGVLYEHLYPKMDALVAEFKAAGYATRVVDMPHHPKRALILQRKADLRADGRMAYGHLDIAGFIKNKKDRYSPSTFQPHCLVYPAGIMERYEQVEMLGRTWNVPSPAKRYLRLHYGPTWREPNPDWNPIMGHARVRGYYRRANVGRKR